MPGERRMSVWRRVNLARSWTRSSRVARHSRTRARSTALGRGCGVGEAEEAYAQCCETPSRV